MPLGIFAAGRYAGSLTPPSASPLDVGITVEGYTIGWQFPQEIIQSSDAYGESVIEAITQGCNVSLSCVFHEYIAGSMRMINPFNNFNAGVGAQTFLMPVVGAAVTDLAGSLVLTAAPNTLAAANGPASLTAAKVAPTPETINMLFGPKHRTLPFQGRIFPYSQSGIKFFTTT